MTLTFLESLGQLSYRILQNLELSDCFPHEQIKDKQFWQGDVVNSPNVLCQEVCNAHVPHY